MAERFDPMERARALYAENLRLRELIALVGQDLEGIAREKRYAARIRRCANEGLKG